MIGKTDRAEANIAPWPGGPAAATPAPLGFDFAAAPLTAAVSEPSTWTMMLVGFAGTRLRCLFNLAEELWAPRLRANLEDHLRLSGLSRGGGFGPK